MTSFIKSKIKDFDTSFNPYLYLQNQRRSSTSSTGLPNPKITITLAPNVDQSSLMDFNLDSPTLAPDEKINEDNENVRVRVCLLLRAVLHIAPLRHVPNTEMIAIFHPPA